jgi:hypothetical protein
MEADRYTVKEVRGMGLGAGGFVIVDTQMANEEPSLIDRMCREALDRLHRSIGTKAGIAKARLREAADQISAAHAAGVRAGMLRAAQIAETVAFDGCHEWRREAVDMCAAAIRAEAGEGARREQ